MTRRLFVTLFSVLLASGAATGAAAVEPATCTGTITGAVKATFTCTVSVEAKGKVTQFTITAAGPVAGLKSIVVADYQLPGAFTVGRFDDETRPAGSSKLTTTEGKRFVSGTATDTVILYIDTAERMRGPTARYLTSGRLEVVMVPEGGKGAEAKLKVLF
jgi:hypothetical protein